MVGGSTYDLGRLGAEIAFTVGKEDLDLNNLILEEPSAGGADLHTADWSALMQARLLNVGNGRLGERIATKFGSDGKQAGHRFPLPSECDSGVCRTLIHRW